MRYGSKEGVRNVLHSPRFADWVSAKVYAVRRDKGTFSGPSAHGAFPLAWSRFTLTAARTIGWKHIPWLKADSASFVAAATQYV